jgi:hypothetical protein
MTEFFLLQPWGNSLDIWSATSHVWQNAFYSSREANTLIFQVLLHMYDRTLFTSTVGQHTCYYSCKDLRLYTVGAKQNTCCCNCYCSYITNIHHCNWQTLNIYYCACISKHILLQLSHKSLHIASWNEICLFYPGNQCTGESAQNDTATNTRNYTLLRLICVGLIEI